MLIPKSFEKELLSLRQRGVLQKVQPASLATRIRNLDEPQKINVCVLSCCDGHQFFDLTRQMQGYCAQGKRALGLPPELSGDCIHWRTENGGPFALSTPTIARRQFGYHEDRVDLNILASIYESMCLKKTNVVLLIGHSVCGKVANIFQNLEEYVQHLAGAKARVCQEFGLESTQVIAHLQVCGQEGRRTFHVDYSAVRQVAA